MTPASFDASVSSILIVEDEARIADDIRERLTRFGFQVVGTADTADIAVQTAASKQPDLVLMDIRLKGTRDGIEAGAEILNRLRIPVVYLMAHSDKAALRRAEETGPFGYLLKPFQETELLVAVEMAISRHRLQQRLNESEVRYNATLAEHWRRRDCYRRPRPGNFYESRRRGGDRLDVSRGERRARRKGRETPRRKQPDTA